MLARPGASVYGRGMSSVRVTYRPGGGSVYLGAVGIPREGEKDMRITNKLLETIADLAVMSARENAFETVREQAPKYEGALDLHPEFEDWYRATLEGILDDSLRNPRSCMDYWPNASDAKPLTDKQIAIVRKFAGA